MEHLITALAVIVTSPLWLGWAIRMRRRWREARRQAAFEGLREDMATVHRRLMHERDASERGAEKQQPGRE